MEGKLGRLDCYLGCKNSQEYFEPVLGAIQVPQKEFQPSTNAFRWLQKINSSLRLHVSPITGDQPEFRWG